MSEIRRHKTFDKDVATIIDYIRSSGGTVVTINTVVEKTGLNTVYANNVLKVVKENPIIEVSKDESNKRSAFFKVKEAPVQVLEPIMPKLHKKYKNLTEEQTTYVLNILAKRPLGQSTDTLMSIVNTLAGFGGTEIFVNKYASRIGDLLILRTAQVRLYADILQKVGLLLIDDDKARLLLNGETAESILKSVSTPVPEKTEPVVPILEETIPMPELVIVHPEPEVKIEPVVYIEKEPEQEITPEIVPSIEIDPNSEFGSTLISNMESFKGMIGQFQAFMGEMISQVGGGNNKSEIEELKTMLSARDQEIDDLKKLSELYKKQLEEGNKSLTRFITENSNLKEALTKKCDENRANKKVIAAHKEANDNVFAAMQERFQILLADINNTISDYTRIPAWQITSAHTARVQSQIINAITSAMNDLIDSNCATIVG